MSIQSRQFLALHDLRQFVRETLCQHGQLEVGTFPMMERILIRSEKPCGIYFCLHGPGSFKITAIWETDTNSLLFYDCSGERFQTIRLVAAPCLEPQVVA